MKNKIYTLIAILFLFSSIVKGQAAYQWAHNMGNTFDQTNVMSGKGGVVTDASGNVYMTGSFRGTVDFDPGAGTFNLTSNTTYWNAYIAKYTSSGAFVWAGRIGINNNNTSVYGWDLAIDGSSNIYVTFWGTTNCTCDSIDFDPGIGKAYKGMAQGTLAFAKYDQNGNYLFAKVLPGMSAASTGTPDKIKVSPTGQIYVYGYVSGIFDMDPGVGTVAVGSSSYNYTFISKYDGNGNYILSQGFPQACNCTQSTRAFDMVLDASSNVYMAGYFSKTTDFNPGPGVANLSPLGTTDAFVAKFDSSLNYSWAFNIGSSSGNQIAAKSIALDPSNNVLITGYFQGTADFDPGAPVSNLVGPTSGDQSMFYAKYSNSGTYMWAKMPPLTTSSFANPSKIISDAIGNSYITGCFSCAFPGQDFDPSVGTLNLYTPSFGSDMNLFIAKYDPSGNFTWASNCSNGTNSFNNSGNYSSPFNMVLLGNSLYVAGAFYGTGDFDPGAGTVTLSSAGGSAEDIFFAKYLDCAGGGPAVPGSISGNPAVCSGSTNTYSVAVVAGATSYIWTVPGGWTGTSTTNTISTTASATSGNVTVKATNACGTSAAQTLSVTIITTPATPGTISGSANICSGSANTYSVASIAGATSYNWSYPAGWSGVSATNTISATSSATSGSVTVSATNACGTSAVKTLSVTVNNPPATPGAISGSVTICSGSTNTYSVASVAGATTYNWSYPSGWSGVSTTNTISATASATSGSVTVSATNACGTSAVKTLSVTVNTIPATPGAISGLATLCSGAAASNYSVSAVAGATSYTWSLAGGWSGASSTNIISATPGTSGTFSITATNACGTSVAQTFSVTVNTTPTITVNSGTICSGQSFTIVPSGANTYTIQGGSAVVSPITNTNYTVTGTSAQGCVSTSSAISAVNVNATPTITVNSGAICSGQSFTMSPSGASTYTFSSGSAVVTPTANATYTVDGTSAQGCVSTSSAISNVTINSLPTITVNSGAICSGQSFTMSPSGANTYTYSSGSSVVTPTTNATYSVTGTSSQGCVSASPAVSTVTVNPLPIVTYTQTPNTVCVNASPFTLSAGIPGGGTYSGTAVTGSTFNPTTAGTGTFAILYTFTDVNNCTNTVTDNMIVSGCAGISQHSNLNTQISIYPNPFNDKITIITNGVNQPIHVFNMLGSLVYTGLIDTEKIEINLSSQSSGIYFVRIGSVTKKIIKE